MTWWPPSRKARQQKLERRERDLEREAELAKHRNLQAIEHLKLAIRNSPEVAAVQSISEKFK